MKIAINKTVINKPQPHEQGRITTTYQNLDLTQQEVADYINQGFAFCAQHKDQRRKSANFTESGFVAVDIDSGMSVEEAMSNEFVTNHGAILYTTPSHTEEFPRFRIIFELTSPISSGEVMKNAYKGIIKKFGGDPSCKDACRQFYGCKDSNPTVFGNVLPDEELATLINLGSETKNQTDTKNVQTRERHSIISRTAVDLDTIITCADGTTRALRDIPVKTPIHCPVHVDRKPSAFVVKSKKGVIGVHCSSCNATFFTSNEVPLYDFNYNLTNLAELEAQESEIDVDDEFLPDLSKSFSRINQEFLDYTDLTAPLTFVKSPKGTGKTYWLEKIVEECRVQGLSVLLIGHRRSLIQSVAHRLGLTSYITKYEPDLGDKKSAGIQYNAPTSYYAICADSLSTLLNPEQHKYDVVLVDEVEQVFSHLTASTLRDRRIETFLYFKHYVNVAKNVVVLDADLNALTVNTLGNFLKDGTKKVRFVINEYKQPKQRLWLYESVNHLHFDLMDSINLGLRCFVCTNAKARVKKLAAYINDRFGDRKSVLSITSENSQDPAIQHFIRNINTEILNYDVVIVSPSVGTGVDITFPNKAKRIHRVFGFFVSRVNTHFDIDQQISRVRHPGQVRMWISSETFRFDTNPEVIKTEVKQTDLSARQLLEIQDDGTLVYNQNDEYLELYANVKSLQRGSKNNLKHHFKKLKEHEGWLVREVIADEYKHHIGRNIKQAAAALDQQERINRILSAPLITKSEYIKLQGEHKLQRLLSVEESAMRRYEIESFYLTEVDKDLIVRDDEGSRRHQIRMYEQYKSPDLDLRQDDLLTDYNENKKVQRTDRKERLAKKQFFKELFTKAGLADSDKDFITLTPIEGDSLSDFADFCVQHKQKIARWFEIDIRKDVKQKPAQQLGTFLRLLGIEWDREKPVKKNGTKVYRYFIPQSEVDELDSIMSIRQNTELANQWHQQRESTTENRLFPPEPEDTDPTHDLEELLSGLRQKTPGLVD